MHGDRNEEKIEMSSRPLSGVIPPLVTPLDDNRNVDESSLRRLVDFQITAGVDALFVLGSSGEFSGLDFGQRETVLTIAKDAARGRVPILTGIAAPSTAIAQEYLRQGMNLGLQDFVVTPPFYYNHTQDEVIRHFRELRRTAEKPLIAYTVPILVKVPLAVDTIVALANEQTICAIKDSSGDMDAFRRLLIATRSVKGFSVMSGMELFVDSVLNAGAHGVVPGLANVAPGAYVQLYQLCRSGEWEQARQLQERLIRLFDICRSNNEAKSGSARALSAFKSALKHQGILATCQMTLPFDPLSPEEERRVKDIMLEVELFDL